MRHLALALTYCLMEKYFTLEETNRALSLISPIVNDILTKMKEAERLHGFVKTEKFNKAIDEGILLSTLGNVEKLLNEIEYHMKEITSIGVFLKDLNLGVVDFPCIHQERLVYLCWKFGEPHVSSWHETEDGFAQRKAVDASFYALQAH